MESQRKAGKEGVQQTRGKEVQSQAEHAYARVESRKGGSMWGTGLGPPSQTRKEEVNGHEMDCQDSFIFKMDGPGCQKFKKNLTDLLEI